MKKRIICLGLAVFLVLSLFAGCKKKSAAKQAAATTSPSQATAQAATQTGQTTASSAASGNSSGKSVSGSSADDRHIKVDGVSIDVPINWKKDSSKANIIAQISNSKNTACVQVEYAGNTKEDINESIEHMKGILSCFAKIDKCSEVKTETRWNQKVATITFSGYNPNGTSNTLIFVTTIYTLNTKSGNYRVYCFAKTDSDFKNTDFNQVLNAISFD